MASPQERINAGAFIPTTNIWDASEIQSIDVNSEQFKELLVRLYQNINTIALSVNIRDAGYYDETEFINGQLLFPNPSLSSTTSQTPTYRQIFRKVINFGALPNSAAKSVAHDIAIDSTYTFTRIYGTSSDTSALQYIPIPFAGASAQVSLEVNATNVTVTTTSNRSSFTITYIVVEYVKE